MNKVGFVFAFVSFTFIVGCFAGPPVVASDTDVGSTPAADGGTVTPAVDAGPAAVADAGMPAPGTDAGVAPATPDAGPPAAEDAGTAPTTRFCGDGLIGDRVRLTFSGMHDIRSFADHVLTGAGSGVLVYTSSGTQFTFAPGDPMDLVVYEGGTLNVHPFEGGTLTFDSRMANLQAISSATHDVTCEAKGITAEVFRGGSWVPLPAGFCYFGWDTQGAGVHWGSSPDPLIPAGARIGRALLNLNCSSQFKVYEDATFRPAR